MPYTWSVIVSTLTTFCILTLNKCPSITHIIQIALIPLKTLNLCSLYSKVCIDFLNEKAAKTCDFLANFDEIVDTINAIPQIDRKIIAK